MIHRLFIGTGYQIKVLPVPGQSDQRTARGYFDATLSRMPQSLIGKNSIGEAKPVTSCSLANWVILPTAPIPVRIIQALGLT